MSPLIKLGKSCSKVIDLNALGPSPLVASGHYIMVEWDSGEMTKQNNGGREPGCP